MIQEKKTYETKDLVLKVDLNYDDSKLPLKNWDNFLNELCGNRNYQKEAILNSIVYLATYKNIEQLVKKNHKENPEIRKRYPKIDQYFKKIQIPMKNSGTIDLATGTGKSYVMFGIAQIMIGLKLVDKVLVLCPSTTIEKGLIDKFTKLVTEPRIKEAMPINAIQKNPRIVNANVTIKTGDICIENVHAIYKRTDSSIEDSFSSEQGYRTLVLNDESHHIYNRISNEKKIKIWKDFLLNSEYNFRYILGFTGTAYIKDDYFNDVIYRYSLRESIMNRYVKEIQYVEEDDSTDEYQHFQKAYQNHKKNKSLYPGLRPLTILITNKIQNAKMLETKLIEFLSEKEEESEKELRVHKVMTVTSAKSHQSNLKRLENVDSRNETIEWIISVSMLTEGWDVKNVFQIVPMEERAFNSKLLIAQVLGRGLRIPDIHHDSKVIVLNHPSWGSKIKGLVNEILEIEMRLYSTTLNKMDRGKYHFKLYNINYEKTERTVKNTNPKKGFDYKRHSIALESAVSEIKQETQYSSIKGEKILKVEYDIKNRMTPIKEVVNKIYHDFKDREWEGKTLKLSKKEYTENILSKQKIETDVRYAMKNAGIQGDEIDEKNKRNIFKYYNKLLRKKNKSIIVDLSGSVPKTV